MALNSCFNRWIDFSNTFFRAFQGSWNGFVHRFGIGFQRIGLVFQLDSILGFQGIRLVFNGSEIGF